MIGDRNVLVAECLARADHRFRRVAPIAPDGMHVKITADILDRQQGWYGCDRRRRELLVAIPDLRRNELESEPRVEFVFARSRMVSAGRIGEAFAAQAESFRRREAPERLDMPAGSREVDQLAAGVSRFCEAD